MLRRLLAPLLVASAAFAALWPSLRNGFVGFDDPRFILNNPHFKGLSRENLRWIFTPSWPEGGHFDPLTWLSFSLDWRLWKLDPFGYHLTSLLIHCAAGAVFCAMALKLLERAGAARPEPAALLAALFFAVHPLRVESVAWATERSDVLSGLFYLLTVSYYLDRRIPASLGFFAASLLSKSIGMTLPLILILLDVYPLGRLPADPRQWAAPGNRAVWTEKLPFFLLSAAAAAAAAFLQLNSGAMRGLTELPLLGRAGIAVYGLAFYVGKTVFPISLLPLYAIPPDLGTMAAPMALAGAAAVLLTVLAVLKAKTRPGLLAVWIFYLVTLSPVSGLAHTGPQIAADRYTYLSCLGWALLAGWGCSLLPGRTAWMVGGAWTLVLGGLAWTQCGIWRDTESLWAATAARDPGHFVARNLLGNVKARQGKTAEALELYSQALTLHPGYGSAHNNLGNLLVRMGREAEALSHYEAALAASPGHRALHFNWGLALERLGRRDEAARHFRQELEIDPGHAGSRQALERMKRKRGEGSSPR